MKMVLDRVLQEGKRILSLLRKKIYVSLRRFQKRGGFSGIYARFMRRGGFRGMGERFLAFLQGCDGRTLALGATGILMALGLLVLVFSGSGKKEKAQTLSAAETALSDGGEQEILIEALHSPDETPVLSMLPEPSRTPLHFERGYTGLEVSDIQLRLMKLGYMDNDEPTELFGPYTKSAVELFERSAGLRVDGELDEEEYELLMSDKAPKYVMSLGFEGTDIREMQKRLIELSYLEEGSDTGYFGTVTEEAVKEFQKRNRLTVDGKIGEYTYEALYSEDAVARAVSYGDNSDEVLKIQKRLYKLGYMTTEPDGNFGADTKSAVKLFQEKNALIADGYVGPATRALLYSDEAEYNALRIGDSGSMVEKVQQKLKTLGYLKKVTGYYGSDTEYAVKAFQSRNGLTKDGKTGAKTLSVLLSDSAKGPSSGYQLPGSSSSSASSGTSSSSGKQPSSSGSSSGSSSSGSSSSGSYADTSAGSLEKMLSVALSKQGCKYVSGGKGPNTFDCSGFVYYCLNQAGVKQSYMTSKAWRSCSKYQKISSMSDIRRGDIIVFDGHVAMALDSSTMVHAGSTKGCVYTSSFNTKYWKEHFYCAFRVF